MKSYFFSPSRMILLSMAFAIIAGTALLMLPQATYLPINFIDLLFTSTSCVCVTGLSTIPFESFTPFGHTILLILIQIGGLGLITLTLFLFSLFTNLGLATQVMTGEMFDLESWKGTKQLLIFIIVVTALCELIGTYFIYQTLKIHFDPSNALFYSLFHAVSAFCNAGIYPLDALMNICAHSYSMLIVTSLLTILGGIGFITLKELYRTYIYSSHHEQRMTLTLQTRIILSNSFILSLGSALIFWLLERYHCLASLTMPHQLLTSLFTSITTRSAGFFAIPAICMQQASLFIIMVNSFIGTAPGSTGSGIKITTAALLIATINTAIQGKTAVNIKGRRIMKDQIYKALAVVALGIAWILIVTFFLLITEQGWQFIDILFEATNAFTNLGATLGVTPYLSTLGKFLIMTTMFAGRIGSLTLMIALRKREEKNEFLFPEERVMIS